MKKWVMSMTLIILFISCASQIQKAPVGQTPHSFKKKITKTLSAGYLLYLPKDYYQQTEKNWPLILFLHGAGERGNDLSLVKKHGPPQLVENDMDFPFMVVSPQCPTGEVWSPDVVVALLDKIEETYRIDTKRIYLTGLSMGGFGTWETAIAYPNRFAAIAPICGGGEPLAVCQIKHVPTRVFHGAKDGVVPIKRSREMVAALKTCGGDVKFTVYPDAGHDSWTQTYNNADLYDWFLSHKLK